MPRGVWLKKIAYSGKILLLEGSAISRQKNELINAHSLVSALKKENVFLKYFSDVEMGSVNRRSRGKAGIADFLITIKVEEEEE